MLEWAFDSGASADAAAEETAVPPEPVGGAVVLGLDIGGTQIRAAAVLADGSRLGRRAIATPDGAGAVAEGAVYSACEWLLRAVLEELPAAVRDRVVAVGISSAGPVDPWRGVVVDPPNVPALRDSPLADELEARLGLPAYLERDTNVAALAEHWLGAARGCSDFLYVTVSTGLGGSIFRDGSLLLGPDGTAGELGHVTLLMDDGPACGCGGTGHLEGIASGSGLARQAQAALSSTDSGFLADRAARAALSGRDVAEGEQAGDAVCAALMERARGAFALACVGWVNAFNPEKIVVGGTVAERQGELWLAPARAAVETTVLAPRARRVRIVPAELGEDVSLVGARPLVAGRHGDPAWRTRRGPGAR
jgi:glucokinase